MGITSRNKRDCLGSLLDLLNCLYEDKKCGDEDGCLALAYGHHEVTVSTAQPPSVVYLTVSSADAPVCQGDVNMVGYTSRPDGFVLYADIKTNAAEVCWVVEY